MCRSAGDCRCCGCGHYPEINSRVQPAVNVISGFAGTGANVLHHYGLAADSTRYRQVSQQLLQAAGVQFFETMKSLR